MDITDVRGFMDSTRFEFDSFGRLAYIAQFPRQAKGRI